MNNRLTTQRKIIPRTTKGGPSEYREPGMRAVKPRDAATLIIVRRGATPKILMGKRASTHAFMPNKFVFPGGRLDPVDQRLQVPGQLKESEMSRLRMFTRKSVSDRTLRGLALASIREAFEETGLIVGRPTQRTLKTSHAVWQQYFDHGVEPPLEAMDFIARAVTPAYRKKRFDTRFFMVFDESIYTDPEDLSDGSGELLDLHWLTISEARTLDLPAVTHWVIDLIEARLNCKSFETVSAPARFIRFIGRRTVEELL